MSICHSVWMFNLCETTEQILITFGCAYRKYTLELLGRFNLVHYSPLCSDRLRGPPSLQSSEYWGLFPWG
jgi:hypothetical protein